MSSELYRRNRLYNSSVNYPLYLEKITEITDGFKELLDGVSLFENKLYATARTYIVCYCIETKNILWEKKCTEVFVPTDGYDGLIYLFIDGFPSCLNTETGEVIWKKDNDFFPVAASKEYIFCRDTLKDSSAVICYKKNTGEETWRLNTYGTFNSASVEQGIVIIEGFKGYHICEEKTGKVIWETTGESWRNKNLNNIPHKNSNMLGPLINGIFYIGIDGGVVAAVEVETGNVIWVKKTPSFRVPQTIIYHEGKLYITTVQYSKVDGFLTCLDAKTGELIFKTEDTFTPAGANSPILTNNFVIGMSGRYLGFFDITKQEFVWRYKHKKNEDFGYHAFAVNDQYISYDIVAKKIYWFRNKTKNKK